MKCNINGEVVESEIDIDDYENPARYCLDVFVSQSSEA